MKNFFIALLVFALIVAGGIFGCKLYLDSLSYTMNEETVIIEIPKGYSFSKIVDLLEENQIIKNSTYFKIIAMKNNQASDLKAGRYQISPKESIDELLTKLAEGKEIKRPTVSVTIPEGYTIKQIAKKLQEYNVITNEEEFIEKAFNWESERWFLKDANNNLEGYLYPDTYNFFVESTPEEVVERMLNRLDEKIQPYQDELTNHKLNIHEIMTIASLIEKEARHDEDRPKISSVIYNRLNKDMILQIDASILYATGHKEEILKTDLQIDSPYNLYKYKGLPPTPIASPGIKSIEAALFPDTTDYLYYVADRKTGYHHFSKTYEEHKANTNKYWKVD